MQYVKRYGGFLLMALFLFTFTNLLLRGIASNANDHKPSKMEDMMIKIEDASGKIQEIPLESYCVGVLSGEMPASFEPEALRAQAMAIRTYALHAKESGGRHEQADLCTTTHCQVWQSEAQMQQKWGSHYAAYHQKIEEAVNSTKGLIITYQGQAISPVYHSTCGSKTEAAGDYWSKDVPYLQSVPCNCAKISPKAKSELAYSYAELAELLGQSEKAVAAMKVVQTSPNGRVQELQCGDVQLSGQKVRELLHLNSTDFALHPTENGILFAVSGYGHGVGLCQYGANEYAKEGLSAEEIIYHYYTGVQIESISS